MINGVREHLVDAVRQRLVADTPVGIYLSGGIDSSSLLGIVTKLQRETKSDAKVRAFSISFSNGGELDEGEIAKRTAEYWDAEHDIIHVSYSDLVQHFENVVWHGEQPVANFSTVSKALLSEKAQASGYKVVLSGEGSDEIFGGYGFFRPEVLREPDLTMPEEIPESVRLNAFAKEEKEDFLVFQRTKDKYIDYFPNDKDDTNPSPNGHNTKGTKRSYDEYLAEQLPRAMLNGVNSQKSIIRILGYSSTAFSDAAVKEYGTPNPKLAASENFSGTDRFKARHRWHPLHTALYTENRSFLPNYLLSINGDRIDMMNSVETRPAFLDHPFVEYVNGLPPSIKIKYEKDGTLNEKWILKEAAKPFITEELYKRAKQPFVAPAPSEKDTAIVHFIKGMITKENVDRLGWVSFERVEDIKHRYLETRNNDAFLSLIYIASYIILSKRFNVPTYV
jgi:asparagine synthase (glutamine-hydrolysing)